MRGRGRLQQFEFHDYSAPRLYTVHQVRPDGGIDGGQDFQQYDSLKEARKAARAFAASRLEVVA